MLRKYAKAIGAVVVTMLTFVASILTDGVTDQEWVMIAGTFVSAVGVAVVPELPSGIAAWAKTVVAALSGGLTVLAVVIIGGLTTQEVIEVIVAALGCRGRGNRRQEGDFKERATAQGML